MATDANFNHSDNADVAPVVHESDVERVIPTQSATQIQIAAGESIVRIQVTPGEILSLPFAQDGMMARLDDGNGNLAVKVGEVTVILLGYTAATAEAPVTLLDKDGTTVDVASVVAATDPSIDIATAAGPAAGDQGSGVDNNGGLFAPFDPNAGIGGLNAVGGLSATELQYGLIQRAFDRLEENDEINTSPTLVSVTPGQVVNEDDLERNEEFSAAKELDPYPSHVLIALGKLIGGQPNVYWAGPEEQGNDPFDADDHEDGSQNAPSLPEPSPEGVDLDREPLSSTAVAQVNFFGDVPGHLSFSNGGTPIIDQLTALGLTSHSLEVKYAVLPGATGSHGETLVAYTEVTYDGQGKPYTVVEVVFTISFREFEGTDPISSFDIDFTLYGVVDNVPGINDADGNILDALDIDVPFFMVDSNNSVTPAPAGSVVFTDIDDVPELGYLDYDWVEQGEGKGSVVVTKAPSDTGIVHDETPGQDAPEDIDPQQYGYEIGKALAAAGWPDAQPIGAASTSISVSFGADGRAGIWDSQAIAYVGNKEAGKTVFAGDNGAYANAFQFYIGDAAAPLSGGLTNWTITVDGVELAVQAEQVDANTIKGYAEDGDLVIPVFVLSIDPSLGQVILTQLHQVNQADTTDADEATLGLQIAEGASIIVRATDYDGDFVETPLDVTIRDDGPTISLVGYTNDHDADDEGSPNNGDGVGYLDEDWLGGGNNDNDPRSSDDIGGTQALATLAFDVGADGPNGAFPLSLDPATITVSGNIDGDLKRASDGANVKLVATGDGQVVFGYADADNDGVISQAEQIDDNKMFSISIVGNQIAFNLYQALRHDAAGGGLGDGNTESDILFNVPVTVTDADGDTKTVSVKFDVDDDMIVAHDETTLTVEHLNQSIGGNLLANDNVGADRPATVKSVYIDNTVYEQTGNGYTYYLDEAGHLISPQLAIGALSISPNGDWTFTQLKNTDGEVLPTFTFSYTAQDADGDTDSAEFSFTLKHFQPATFEDETAIIDEDGLPNGSYDDPAAPTNDGTPGDDVGGHQVNNLPDPATEAVFRNTLGNGFNWNGDVGAITFTFDEVQIAKIVLLDGTVLTLANVEGNGTGHVTVWAGEPGNSDKVLEFNVIDNATAVYEVELFSPIKHPAQDNPQTQNAETYFEDNVLLPVTVTATNGGGAPSHTLTMSIDDDFIKQWGWGHAGPGLIENSEVYQWIDEDFVGNGNQDKDAQGNSNWDTNGDDPFFNVSPGSVIATNVGKGHLSAIFGADGPGELPYGLAIIAPGTAIGANYWGAGNPLETTAGSALKVLSSSATELVIADNSNNPVMTLTIDQVTGTYTFTQIQPLDHHGIDTEDNIYLRFGVSYTDGDGDTRLDDIGFVIDDDGPETQNSTSGVSFVVDEATPATDDTEGYSWMFHPVNYGADGPGTVSYSLTGIDGQPLADTVTTYKDAASGEFIKLHQVDANTIEGRTAIGGELVFVVSLGAQAVKFDLQRSIDHTGEQDSFKYLSLPIHVTQTATDGDGDSAQATATANMSVRVEDAGPDAVDDGTYAITQTGTFVTNALTANDEFGADGPGQVTKVTFNGTDYLMSGASLSIDVTGGKLTVNSDGSWFFEQPNNLPVPTTHQFSYTIKDADGSTDSATFAVALRTDMPVTAVNDWLITSETQFMSIPTDWLVRNDIDDHKYLLDILNAQSPGNTLHVSAVSSHVEFDLNPQGLNPGANSYPFPDSLFTYTVTDEVGHSDQGGTLVDYVLTYNVAFDNNQVTGTHNGDIIIGNEFGETLSGSGGDDILYGGRDPGFPVTDMLDGGGGNDWLVFGPSDILQGGLDFDTVRFEKFSLANVDLDHSGADFVGRIHDVEAFDLRTSGAPANFGNHTDGDNGLSAQDVIDMTDANDTLYILGRGDGEAGPGLDDKVYLDGVWNQNGQVSIVDPTGATSDYITFLKYTSGTATLYIQNTIDVD